MSKTYSVAAKRETLRAERAMHAERASNQAARKELQSPSCGHPYRPEVRSDQWRRRVLRGCPALRMRDRPPAQSRIRHLATLDAADKPLRRVSRRHNALAQ